MRTSPLAPSLPVPAPRASPTCPNKHAHKVRQKSVSLARTIAPSVPCRQPVRCTNGRARWWGGRESRGRTRTSLPPAIASKTAHKVSSAPRGRPEKGYPEEPRAA